MLIPPMVIDQARMEHAVNVYNSLHCILTDAGWTEDKERDMPFWPDGKPLGTWRHPKHPHTHSMDAAFGVVVSERERAKAAR